jgi:hypothetical protein
MNFIAALLSSDTPDSADGGRGSPRSKALSAPLEPVTRRPAFCLCSELRRPAGAGSIYFADVRARCKLGPPIQAEEATVLADPLRRSTLAAMGPADELDTLLERSDPDSSDWADGRGHERAGELLLTFAENDWDALHALMVQRDARWRACLTGALTPRQGAPARRLLLELACAPEAETAFLAAISLAFHCGINDGPAGPFIDESTQNAEMMRDARSAAGLVDAVRRLETECDPRFRRRFELLLGVLLSRASV